MCSSKILIVAATAWAALSLQPALAEENSLSAAADLAAEACRGSRTTEIPLYQERYRTSYDALYRTELKTYDMLLAQWNSRKENYPKLVENRWRAVNRMSFRINARLKKVEDLFSDKKTFDDFMTYFNTPGLSLKDKNPTMQADLDHKLWDIFGKDERWGNDHPCRPSDQPNHPGEKLWLCDAEKGSEIENQNIQYLITTVGNVPPNSGFSPRQIEYLRFFEHKDTDLTISFDLSSQELLKRAMSRKPVLATEIAAPYIAKYLQNSFAEPVPSAPSKLSETAYVQNQFMADHPGCPFENVVTQGQNLHPATFLERAPERPDQPVLPAHNESAATQAGPARSLKNQADEDLTQPDDF